MKKKTWEDWVMFGIEIFLIVIGLVMTCSVYCMTQGLDPFNMFMADREIEQQLAKIHSEIEEIHLAQPSTPAGFQSMYIEVLGDLQAEEGRLMNEQKRRKK